MKAYIQELEVRNNKQKDEYIKNFLRERNIPFSTQTFSTLLAEGENIIVDYPFNKNPNGKKIYLTAHYNAWFKSPGANDNASGVAVLLGFLEKLLIENKDTALKFIFFDLEDGWAVRGGSKAYVREFGVSDVEKNFNIDHVGMGRMLLLWPSKGNNWLNPLVNNAESLGFSPFHLPTARIVLITFPAERGFVSDHLSFLEAGCMQACSLSTFPKEDLPLFEPLLRGEGRLRFIYELLKYRLFGKGTVPKLMKHYHNRDDRSEFVEEQNLQNMLTLLWRVT
ncbi:MAG: M28 family peptidase [Candidatus Doudnabacteria bacterium]|nr:M28 family peptidase [Candidatus Doudnabacteria bacterium]